MFKFSWQKCDRFSVAEPCRFSFSRIGFLSGFLFFGLSWFSPVQAQVTGDGTLGTSVTPNLPCFGVFCETISGGSDRGINTFHSLSQFSLPNSGDVAIFENTHNSQNIFVRVTGGSVSNIQGTIEAGMNPNFDLYLLNPNGITFSPDAVLNLQGSFTASTGTGVNFADGTTFLATGTPQLTMSVPVGLQGGSNAAPIQVQNVNWIFFGNSISLIGGEIQINSSQIIDINGNISLEGDNISLSSSNIITPDGNIAIKGDAISLSSANLIVPNGNVNITGKSLRLAEKSIISVSTSNDRDGETLKIDTSESVDIIDSQASLFAQTLNGIGNAGDIQISTERLTIQDGGTISNSTLTEGNAGNITIDATHINLVGFDGSRGGIYSESFAGATGNGGDVKINTDNLTIQDGATISTSTNENSLGMGGSIAINANNINVTGSRNEQPSLLTTETFGDANAGNLNLSTDRLSVRNGAQILVKSEGVGAAGNLNITANRVELDNRGLLSAETSLASGGEIILQNSQSLSLTNNSEISASTVDGQGGTISVSSSDRIFVDNNSSIVARSTGRGEAGSVQLDTGNLIVQNNSQVSVRNEGIGNAGTLTANAKDILLSDRGQLTASTVAGNGGNIELMVSGSIFLRFNSEISAEAGGFGNGGNITMDVGGFIVAFLSENSDIVASAFQGRGGDIFAKARGIFGFRQFRGVRTSESDFTATSVLGIDGSVTINGVDDFSLDGIPESFIDTEVARGCDVGNNSVSFYSMGSGGLRGNSSTPLSSSEVWEDVTLPQSQGDRFTNHIVEAQEWVTNERGEVVLFARDASDRILLPCS